MIIMIIIIISQNQALQQKSHQKEKHQGIPPCKILWSILKMDKGRTQSNGPNDKKILDKAQGYIS